MSLFGEIAGKEEARQLVEDIAEDMGYLSDNFMENLGQWNPSARRRIEKSQSKLESMAAHAIKTLAKNIYGSNARFVFELLQNADDNKFTKAGKLNEMPYICFHVYPDRIVVDCNEDGFEKQDLEAICTVGQSTKSKKYGYIGAKGIGFKSVFMAAWKVHIQSGYFSFHFKHEKHESGLGMVRPVWDDMGTTLRGPITRMTLYRHKDGDPGELHDIRDSISEQFKNLNESCLLFLRNIRIITVHFYNDDGSLESSKTFQATCGENYRTSLETTSLDDGLETKNSRQYHVTRYTATGLARSTSRGPIDPEDTIASASSSSAEVVLAFPLTHNNEPHLENQDIFAFLPLRKSDYKFIIQSDFDTEANRQNIVTTSRRNMDLQNSIAVAFSQAVLQFCNDPVLCYQWPRFLPSLGNTASPFWDNLNRQIKVSINKNLVIKSRYGQATRLADILYLSPDLMDENGDCLYDDRPDDRFISKSYRDDDWKLLIPYGLRGSDSNLHLNMLKVDLQSSYSRMKDFSLREVWHSKAASSLLHICHHSALQNLDLIPLWGGQWSRVTFGNPIFLPSTKGIGIPSGCNMQILDARVQVNPERRKLIQQLGVREASIDQVRGSIMATHSASRGIFGRQICVSESKEHLRYLFLADGLDGISSPNMEKFRSYFRFYDKERTVIHVGTRDIYLETDDSCGPKRLLEPVEGVPAIPITYLHPSFMQDLPSNINSQSWETWLHDIVGIRRHIRLVTPDGTSLSSEFKHVSMHHPGKFLDMLEFLWKIQSDKIRSDNNIKSQIQALDIAGCCADEDFFSPLQLRQTWLPLPLLQKHVAPYDDSLEIVPFLKIQGFGSPDLYGKWAFLHQDFSVGKDDNVDFYLTILKFTGWGYETYISIDEIGKIADLYIAIEARMMVAEDIHAEAARVLEFMKQDPNILAGQDSFKDPVWLTYENCRWEGPSKTSTNYALKPSYEATLGADKLQKLAHFFCKTLGVGNFTWSDVALELLGLKNQTNPDFDQITELYTYLSELESSDPRMKSLFKRESLIFAIQDGKGGWYKSTECLWSSTSKIRGKVTLNGIYDELQEFFIKELGVQTLTLQMLYDDLRLVSFTKSVDDCKDDIRTFNALLQSDRTPLDPAPLQKAVIFPVIYPGGQVILRNADTDFAIGDRHDLVAGFAGRIKILDYSFEEVRRLKPFFEWVQLRGRYLTESIKEFTGVASDGRTRPISQKNYDIRLKAYSILRISHTFRSTRYQKDRKELYRLLRGATVVEADAISSTVTISQDGKPFNFEKRGGNEHIYESNGSLTIYVPLIKADRDFCFHSAFPLKLAQWLMEEHIPGNVDQEMVHILSMALTCDPGVLGQILDYHSVLGVDLVDEDDLHDQGDNEANDDDEVVSETTVPSQAQALSLESTTVPSDELDSDDDASRTQMTPSRSTRIDTPPSRQPSRFGSVDGQHGQGDISNNSPPIILESTQSVARETSQIPHASVQPRLVSPTHAPTELQARSTSPAATQPRILFDENDRYVGLLSIVIAASRRTGFPSNGAFDMAGWLDVLSGIPGPDTQENFDGLDVVARVRSTSQLERDKKVGAAGELYVFEILSALALPGWGRSNWQSTIRKYVTVHPNYRYMLPWHHRETADLVYPDTEGEFTKLLIENEYLGEDWQEARPKYLIEVKTSTGPLHTPFYMSSNQYQLMQNTHNTDDRSVVYMILRVFWLGDNRVGMRVYLDPEQLRQDGGLVFNATWSVVPGNRPT